MHGRWILISLILLTLPSFSQTSRSQQKINHCSDRRKYTQDRDVIESVCVLVNRSRARLGLSQLRLDPGLSEVAQAYAEDMARRNYFSHTNPEGELAGFRLGLAGIDWKAWGENIAAYHPTPTAVMRAWMNSSGHRANILSRKYRNIGIGYYQNYWVQIFTD